MSDKFYSFFAVGHSLLIIYDSLFITNYFG